MSEQHEPSLTDIAIIGMALRVPGATCVDQFWRNLRSGIESIRSLGEQELLAAGELPETFLDKSYVARTADLDGMELFDPEFFGFSRQEAAVMDPQHRQFLECAWEAIETSARPPKSLNGAVGVFAGCGMGSYFYFNVCSNRKLLDQVGMFLLRHTGNDKDFLSTRASHLFDLRGPSVNIQTACSTSLVAVHFACQSLLSGECDMALAGGVTIELPHRRGYLYKEGEILSPDGHCRSFDHRAAGTVFGSGTGVVVLRRLSDAIASGDPIRAVIKATAINNDGASKAGYLAPSVTGQAQAVVEAHAMAGITADTIQYVECHGTGTRIGDPIEIQALSDAFRVSSDANGHCLVGSVKSNIGHLDTAAGVVGLIKTALALEHGEIPPTVGFEKPNPAIDFAASPFQVCDRLTPWPATKGPRRAGINSLGVGGTNAYAVLEQAPAKNAPSAARADGEGPHVLVLSAKSRKALDESGQRLAEFLESKPEAALPDIAATLFHGRSHFVHRRAVAARDRAHAAALLRATDRNAAAAHQLVDDVAGAVFLFPGGGAQYPSMARWLYRNEASFRKTVDEGLSYLPAEAAAEVRAVWLDPETPDAALRFRQPDLQLPAILITEIAIARLWMGWGVKPVALIGHSMGENAAAHIAGVLSFKNAVELVHLRGKLFTEIEPGGMLSVPLAETDLLARLPAGLDLASVNAPELSVVSGANDALDRFQASLSQDGIEAIRVPIDIAAHSRMLTPILERFEAFLKGIALAAPKIAIVSNLTGEWLTDAQARDPGYWRAHLSSTVKFANGIAKLARESGRIYIEVGPGRTLSSLVKAHGSVKANQVINSLPHPDEAADDHVHFVGALGRAWAVGHTFPLERMWDLQKTRRIPLPTYPFQHERYWIEASASQTHAADTLRHESIEDWFAMPMWVRSPLLLPAPATAGANEHAERRWLIYSDGSKLAARIANGLEGRITVVTAGSRLKKIDEHRWTVDFGAASHHQELLDELQSCGFQPTDVVYCCGLEGLSTSLRNSVRGQDLQEKLRSTFFVPTFLVRALARLGDPVNFTVLTSKLAEIDGSALDPMLALLLGPVLVAPREAAQVATRCMDVDYSRLGLRMREAEQDILTELNTAPVDRLVALRKGSRWIRLLHKLSLPATTEAKPWLREEGVYVITGGLGGIALEIAEHLARLKKVKLALLARSELPPEAEWDELLRIAPEDSDGARRMRRLRAIRQLGSQVDVFACDITDRDQVERALSAVRAKLGPIAGVIHAAGVMDDEPIDSKSQTSMSRVLLPKVAGAVNLDRLIREPLDFFIVFSSVASTLGLPGQVDYTAANAFLDAFAMARASRAPGRTVAINWNAWRDIGMAARASVERQRGKAPSYVVAHPALDGYSDDSDTGRTFVTDFSIDRHWLLSEHKIKNGLALLSGTTFVELARAAFSVGRGPVPVEINDLTFMVPFQVAEGSPRRLLIHITTEGGSSEITMRASGGELHSLPNVIGDVSTYVGPVPMPIDLDSIRARCPKQVAVRRGGTEDQFFVDFGPRWESLRSVRYGNREALLELELDPKFRSDLEHYLLHPALLDMATGTAQRLIPQFDPQSHFYVPLVYGRLRLYRPMPARFFSHVRLRPESGNGEVFFDITLVNEAGQPFCDISRFGMKRIDATSALVGSTVATSHVAMKEDPLQTVLRDAIAPAEGLAAFDRIMAQPNLVQCMASSVNVETWLRRLASDGAIEGRSGDAGDVGFARPDLDSVYEAPETESEKFLAHVWSELLGIRQIGVDDDFFQLGGHSLHAVRLFAAVKKHCGISLPLSTLLERPSIRKLAPLIGSQLPEGRRDASERKPGAAVGPGAPPRGYSSLVPIQPLGDGPAFYCAAGMGGNPLNLRALALQMGIEQPFYGLQPQGLDGVSESHRTVPEMAAHYISEITAKQPQGPYYLGGYSGGGVVAFEMARQLVERGERIGALVFLDSVAPGVELPSLKGKLARHRERFREDGLRYLVAAGLDSGARLVDRTAAIVRKPLRRMFPYHYRLENIADTWNEAFARYQPSPYSGDAMLFRASKGFVLGFDIGPMNGWDRWIAGEIAINECPGDHSSMCEPPHVRVLARRLKSYLQRQVRDNAVCLQLPRDEDDPPTMSQQYAEVEVARSHAIAG